MSTDPLKPKQKFGGLHTILLMLLVAVLIVIPLIWIPDSDFSGADDQAKSAITEIDSEYKPWFSLIWEPPGEETASLLFALQAAIGSGILFFGLGYLKGRKRGRDEK